VAHEVETYNELIPAPGELSACLLIEYESLRELLGLEDHVWIQVGNLPWAKARFDDRQISTDRISAVQYVKFRLTPEQAAQFPRGAKLVVDHPHYQAERVLSPQELAELSADIA
jgi:hypothetical protein